MLHITILNSNHWHSCFYQIINAVCQNTLLYEFKYTKKIVAATWLTWMSWVTVWVKFPFRFQGKWLNDCTWGTVTRAVTRYEGTEAGSICDIPKYSISKVAFF